jgi:hypothetical protein
MSLQNLLKIGQLETHQTDAAQIGRLLDAASRCLDDARQESITLETRLEAGYRAIMQLSMLVLWANGYRPTTAPGHHRTMIQSLVHSVELTLIKCSCWTRFESSEIRLVTPVKTWTSIVSKTALRRGNI